MPSHGPFLGGTGTVWQHWERATGHVHSSASQSAGPPHPLAELHIHLAFLHAVIAVYGPWVSSALVPEPERARAVRRVTWARRELGRLTPLRRSDGTWQPPASGTAP